MKNKKRGSPTKAKSPRKPKKSKKDDPNKIKRPLSAYLYFTKDFRLERAAKGLDNSKVNEVAKLAGERWKSMSDEQKKPYNEKASIDKERYQQEVQNYEINYMFYVDLAKCPMGKIYIEISIKICGYKVNPIPSKVRLNIFFKIHKFKTSSKSIYEGSQFNVSLFATLFYQGISKLSTKNDFVIHFPNSINLYSSSNNL